MTDRLIDNTELSFVMVPNAVIDEETAFDDAQEKMTYIVLKRHANLNGQNAFPSLATIAKKVPCSESTVKRKIKSLVDKGLITKTNRFKETGGKTSNLYTINDFARWVTENYRAIGQSDPYHRSERPIPQVTVTHEEYSFKNNPLNASTTTRNENTEVGESDHGKTKNQKSAADADFKEVHEFYMKCGWGLPSPFVIENLIADIEDYSKDVVIEAMKIAAERNAKSYSSYTKAIYREWSQQQLTTIEQVVAYEQAKTEQHEANRRRNESKNTKGGKRNASTSKPVKDSGHFDL